VTKEERLVNAQKILSVFSKCKMELNRGKVVFSCDLYGKPWRKQWVSMSPGSFYPRWKAPDQGGTGTIAMAQLVRYVLGKPLLPMGWWRRVVEVGMEPEILDVAKSIGWPESHPCCLCGETLTTGYDWWSLGKTEGICCWMGECRNKKAEV